MLSTEIHVIESRDVKTLRRGGGRLPRFLFSRPY